MKAILLVLLLAGCAWPAAEVRLLQVEQSCMVTLTRGEAAIVKHGLDSTPGVRIVKVYPDCTVEVETTSDVETETTPASAGPDG